MEQDGDRPVAYDIEVVVRPGAAHVSQIEIRGSTPRAVLRIVGEATPTQRMSMVVAVDETLPGGIDSDDDSLIALCAVLVDLGVGAIATRRPVIARRAFAMQAAIQAGSVEAIS